MENKLEMGNELMWKVWKIIWSSDESHPRMPIWKPNHPFELGIAVACTATADHRFIRYRSDDPFEKLPEDVLRIIFSKLSLRERVRTSVLSTKWRHLWRVCPKLIFDGVTTCGQEKRNVQKFIDNVNAVLQQHHGKCVEELAVKIGFEPILVYHLNSWVSFAASSHVKILSLNLLPDDPQGCHDMYAFPFELLDHGGISCLQQVQLSFVRLTLNSRSACFPKLTKLALLMAHISGNDLQIMLSNCFNIEWLSIERCRGNGELKLDRPLPHLQYLNVKYCNFSKIELNSVNLKTFVYKGRTVPIVLSKALELDNVNIAFYSVTVEHVINAFSTGLPNMQSLTLLARIEEPQIPCLIENQSKFSLMKHLRLLLMFHEDVNLSLVSIMRAAPFLEKLEMHFKVHGHHAMVEPLIQPSGNLYSHLKDVCITGFVASKGQLEVLIHLAQNAPELEVLSIDVKDFIDRESPWEDSKAEATFVAVVQSEARRYVEGLISPKCCLRIL